MLPRLEIVRRARPVDLVAPIARALDADGDVSAAPLPQPAPYVAVEAEPDGDRGSVALHSALHSGAHSVEAWYERGRIGLRVGGRELTSRRYAAAPAPRDRLALTLTGTLVTALSRGPGGWTAHARARLTAPTTDEGWCAALSVTTRGAARVRAGGFGQVGLRDLRWVSEASGDPIRLPDGRLALTATHAGLGGFTSGHAGVWALDPASLHLEHLADLYFRRPDRPGVYGDHAVHLVRDGARWLVAASTWGDFDRKPGRLRVTLAETERDLLAGRHVLDARELPIPTGPSRSVGVWDPHLVRIDGVWHVGFVSAKRFFDFHPGLATGPTLDELTFRASAPDRRATEGTTLLRVDETWRVLASDGRDGRRNQRERFGVFDLDLAEIGALDAPYPTNIPWPTLTRLPDGSWLMATFNGRRWGGELPEYGTHGDVVFLRARST